MGARAATEAIPYLRDRRTKVLTLSEIHRSGWTSEKVAGPLRQSSS